MCSHSSTSQENICNEEVVCYKTCFTCIWVYTQPHDVHIFPVRWRIVTNILTLINEQRNLDISFNLMPCFEICKIKCCLVLGGFFVCFLWFFLGSGGWTGPYFIVAKIQSVWVNSVMMHSAVECKSLCPMYVKPAETNGNISRQFQVYQNTEPERLCNAWL